MERLRADQHQPCQQEPKRWDLAPPQKAVHCTWRVELSLYCSILRISQHSFWTVAIKPSCARKTSNDASCNAIVCSLCLESLWPSLAWAWFWSYDVWRLPRAAQFAEEYIHLWKRDEGYQKRVILRMSKTTMRSRP